MKSGGPSKYPLKVIIGVWIIVIFGVNPCGSLGRDRRAVLYLAYLTSRAELSFSFFFFFSSNTFLFYNKTILRNNHEIGQERNLNFMPVTNKYYNKEK